MKSKSLVARFCVITTMVISLAGIAFGQSNDGSITGVVKDSQGGAVPAATVTVINPSNAVMRTATTNEDGIFVFPQLPPGTYLIRIEKDGFKKIEKSNVILGTADKLNVGDFVLEVGAVAETIEIQADAGQLQIKSESGERSDLVTNRQIKDLALNGRNVIDLVRLVPGVSSAGGGLQQSTVNNAFAGFNINGTRNNQHEVTIDGATNLNTGNNTGALVTVNPDAVAEFKVLTSNYQAEYGRAGGGFIQVTTKSGSNEYHGGGRYFRRHDSLNANNFFNNTRGQPRPLYRFNYYGYDLSGPVPLVGSRDNRKLFFFFSQEYYRQLIPEAARNIRVPSEAERNGDFSQTVDGNGNRVFIRDPLLTGICNANDQTACFKDNRIPQGRFFSGGQAILNLYPKPNTTVGGNQFNFTSQVSSGYPRREDILRLDYQITDRTRLSGRFIRNFDEQQLSYGTTTASFNWPLTTTARQNGPGYVLGFTLTHSFSPTLINEFNYAPSFGRVRIAMVDDRGTRRVNNITVPLLFPDANPDDIIPNFTYGGIANQTFPTSAFNGSPFTQTFRIDNIIDNLTKVAGRHTVKTGIYFHRAHNRRTSFTPVQANISFAHDANNPLSTGHPFANALLGIYTQYEQANVKLSNDFVYTNVEGYIQDTWKIASRLTLDYGLRLSYYQPLYDKEGQLGFFNPALFDRSKAVRIYFPVCINNASTCASGANRRAVDPALLVPEFAPTAANTLPANFIGLIVPNSGDIANGIGRAANGYTRGGFDSDKILWSPRFGFAYDLTGDQKTIVRGGFGITYDRIRGDVTIDAISNPPNVLIPRLFFGRLDDIPSLRGTDGARAISNIIGISPDGDLPTVYTYSLSVQRNIGWSATVDVAYVGSLSRHNPQARNLNAIPYLTTFQRGAQDPTRFSGSVVPTVEPGLPTVYSQAGFNFSGANVLPIDFLRPFPGYGDISFREFTGTANYNSLQVSANRRFTRSLTFGISYTLSKTFITSGDDFEITNPVSNRFYDYRLAGFDRTHLFVANYVYDLPKISRYLGDRRFTRAVFDNWQVSGITSFISGTPTELGLSISGINAGQRITGSFTDGPRFFLKSDPGQGASGLLIDPNAFVVPGIGDLGPYPRTYLRNPGVNNHDISIFKNFPLSGEGSRYLQLRFEFFNAFNHTQFAGINGSTNLTTATGQTGAAIFNNYNNLSITNNLRPAGSTSPLGQFFGEYNSARDPRIIQLAVKVYF